MLRNLRRLDVPCVEPFGVVHGRATADGEPLDACLITRHLQFSLPYRALYSQNLRPDTAVRLMDALAVLLVRLHLEGFWWGDVSLSNTLFRRDAGAFAAYLVDAETGELHSRLSDGQREHDLDIARVNIAGELMDLEAGGFLEEHADPFDVSSLDHRALPHAVGRPHRARSASSVGDRWRVDERIRRLNELGFDVDELAITTDIGGTDDPDHSPRSSTPATTPAACCGSPVSTSARTRPAGCSTTSTPTPRRPDRQGEDEEIVAHDWLAKIYEPVTRRVPRELAGKLEPAEMFHEVLEHRWYMSRARAARHPRSRTAIARLRRDGAAGQAGREGRARRRHRGDAGHQSLRLTSDASPGPERICPKRTTIHSRNVTTWTAVHHRQIEWIR